MASAASQAGGAHSSWSHLQFSLTIRNYTKTFLSYNALLSHIMGITLWTVYYGHLKGSLKTRGKKRRPIISCLVTLMLVSDYYIIMVFLFLELGIWAKPRKGRALVWNNMNKDGYCEPLSIHNAAKVNKGHKYIIQRWYVDLIYFFHR